MGRNLMATFTLTLVTGNAAVQTVGDVANLLLKVANRLEDFSHCNADELAGDGRKILDSNGSSVGHWAFG